MEEKVNKLLIDFRFFPLHLACDQEQIKKAVLVRGCPFSIKSIGRYIYIYIYIYFPFFFHSFIGYSSCNIQYKFIIQHKKKEKKEKKKKRRKNPKGVSTTGLTSNARHRP